MRSSYASFLVVLLTIIIGVLTPISSFALAEDESSLHSLPTTVVCAAMLVSLKMDQATAVPVDDFVQSLETLRPALEAQESGVAGLWRKSGVSQVTGFSLSQVERLDQIQSDMIEARGFGGPVVAFREFRGEQVQAFTDLFTSNLNLIQQQVSAELEKRYPQDRVPIMHMLVQMSLLPVVVSNFHNWYAQGDGSDQSLINALVFGALGAGFAVANKFLGPSLTEVRGLEEQMKAIKNCFSSVATCPAEISVASGTLNNTPSSLHRNIFTRQRQNLDLDLITSAAKFSRKTLAEGAATLLKNIADQNREMTEQIQEALNDPRGGIRRMFFDSYFYKDEKSGQPVLLVIYRNKLKRAPRQGDGDLIWAGGGN